MSKQETVSLKDLIQQCVTLEEATIDAIVDVVGHHCRYETKGRLRRKLRTLSIIYPHGILDRLQVFPYVQYCAGQSYPDEMRTVRQCILGK